MEDRHITELSAALRSISTSIYTLAFVLYGVVMFSACIRH